MNINTKNLVSITGANQNPCLEVNTMKFRG